MEILAEAANGQRQPEFMSSHPSPENRIQKLKETIAYYKNGGQNK
jgi:predicted Zn-dependent protease